MKPKTSSILARAIEDGIRIGLRRYYKHRDAGPSEAELSDMADVIESGVWESVDEWFDFDEAV